MHVCRYVGVRNQLTNSTIQQCIVIGRKINSRRQDWWIVFAFCCVVGTAAVPKSRITRVCTAAANTVGNGAHNNCILYSQQLQVAVIEWADFGLCDIAVNISVTAIVTVAGLCRAVGVLLLSFTYQRVGPNCFAAFVVYVFRGEVGAQWATMVFNSRMGGPIGRLVVNDGFSLLVYEFQGYLLVNIYKTYLSKKWLILTEVPESCHLSHTSRKSNFRPKSFSKRFRSSGA